MIKLPEAAAWRYDLAKYRETDLRGRQWQHDMYFRDKPYEDTGMVRNLTPLYTESQMRQAIKDAYEDAAKVCDLHAEIERLRESVQVMLDSDIGRNWVWPESARETWIANARAALENKHD